MAVSIPHAGNNTGTLCWLVCQAGLDAAVKTLGPLVEDGFEIRVVVLPDGADPDSFLREHGIAESHNHLPAFPNCDADKEENEGENDGNGPGGAKIWHGILENGT